MSLLESYTFRNDVEKYSKMSREQLEQHVSRVILFGTSNWDLTLRNLSFLLKFLGIRNDDPISDKIPKYKVVSNDARLAPYMSLVQDLLCEDEALFAQIIETPTLKFEEKVEQVNNILFNHPHLSHHKYKTYSLTVPVSILIIKMGNEFCECI